MAAITATYRNLSGAQIASATSTNKILEQIDATLGTSVLAAILRALHACDRQHWISFP
jgi:hypothetical protein